MKRSTIWIVSVIIGVSFLGLLLLQMRYIEQMVKMRKEQFDESVVRSLNQASRNLEQNETFRYLESFTRDNKSSAADSLPTLHLDGIDKGGMPAGGKLSAHNRRQGYSDFELHTIVKHPSTMPKVLRVDRNNTIDEATKTYQEYIKNAYVYHKGLLDEVIYTILYTASEKPLEERVNFKLLDQDIRNALENNGISIPYHFTVSTADGREVYRCPDYEEKGRDYSYSQVLFRNDPSGRIGVVRIHFPDMNTYLLGTARMMIPALAFTIILFVTFVFTIYVIFRQKKVTEMKNDFINNMTHEFKTPISSISLAAQMLSDHSIKKSEAMYENLARVINDETKRLRFQVEKVLQMSLYDRDNIAFKQKELDAHQLLAGVIKTFTLKVSQNGGSISSDFQAEQADIDVDEMHFTNVIFNLMDNAVKYKRDDVDLHLTLRTWNTGDKINIAVEDKGIGLQKDELKRIFDKFYRVHTGNKHDVKGFGLGLAYVKKIVSLQSGSIHAESEYGQGTKFIITLPIIKK
ncbi:MAG: HAMP domain-containing histidine kinase [Paraprevotella sp.]|nr:HAMP domain-containing histidine kinase [Paraprevotella sp.]